jgi:hypothetical protein
MDLSADISVSISHRQGIIRKAYDVAEVAVPVGTISWKF